MSGASKPSFDAAYPPPEVEALLGVVTMASGVTWDTCDKRYIDALNKEAMRALDVYFHADKNVPPVPPPPHNENTA